jgi:hypothetical protein
MIAVHSAAPTRSPTDSCPNREHAQRGNHILLFVRRRKQNERRITAPYTSLGPATYEYHHGERPMSISWCLYHAMPAGLLEETKLRWGDEP